MFSKKFCGVIELFEALKQKLKEKRLNKNLFLNVAFVCTYNQLNVNIHSSSKKTL